MFDSNKNQFSFDVDSTNELTEEIFMFSEGNYKNNVTLFFVGLIAVCTTILFISYQFGARLNIDRENLPQIFENLKQSDADYIEESATKDALMSETEALTQELLTKQSEAGQLKSYSINKDTLNSKRNELKTELDKLTNELESKKNEVNSSKTNIYTLVLNPGVYNVGKNIPSATYSVTGNGSIIASSAEKETKINEKLSPDIALEVQLFDNYIVKINTVTKFILKK